MDCVAPIMQELYARAADNMLDIQRRFSRITAIGLEDHRLQSALNEVGYRTHIDMVGTGWMPQEILPLAPASCDAIVSVCGLHAINDMVGAMIQIRRALKPDGLFLALMPGPTTLQELRESMAHTEAAHHGGMAPRIAPFLDIRDAGNLLARAGFALPVIDSDTLRLTYSGLRALHADLKAAGQGNMLAARETKALPRAFYRDIAAYYHHHYAAESGRLNATLEIVSLSAWAPHESQQKPLRRGSAEVSLTDIF
jgi:SAM-dependent methyltransferase